MPSVMAIMAHSANKKHIGACEIYRITVPLNTLENNDSRWQVSWVTLEELQNLNKEQGSAALAALFSKIDIIVLPRWYFQPHQYAEARAMVEVFKMLDCKLIYETDDDYTNKHRVVHEGKTSAIDMASMCDAVIASTPYLAKMMKAETGKPVYTCPNSLVPEFWDNAWPLEDYPGITIGLAGTKTHYNDWIVLKDVMPRLMADYPTLHFYLGHFHPDYFDSLKENYPDRVHHLPGVTYELYPGLVKSADIIIAPLNPEDGFNLSKSGIKALEGMAATRTLPNGKRGGAAVITSNHPVYRRVVNGKNGLMAEHTPEAWEQALRKVLDANEYRYQLQVAGNKWVRKNRCIDKTWNKWRIAFNSILRS